MILLNNNAYYLILFSFILVLIAHFKISVLSRATMDVFDVLNEKIEKRFAYVKESQFEQLEERPTVLPNEDLVPKRQPMLDSETLNAFHKLTKSQKQSVFMSIASNVKDISDEAFRYLWNSCYVVTEGYQGAFEIQTALLQLDESQYKECRFYILQEAKQDTKETIPDIAIDVANESVSETVSESVFETVTQTESEIAAETRSEDFPKPVVEDSTKKRGRKLKQAAK